MWYQAMDDHDDTPLRAPRATIAEALKDCAGVFFNTSIRTLEVGNIAAVIRGGELVGGIPEAIEAARARDMLADEGR